MAAVTPDSIRRANMGDTNLIMAQFTAATINDSDTYTSGITGIVDYWFQQKDDPTTQASAGSSVANSAGVFTFYPGEDGMLGTLFVLART